ncbi:CBS domain-containing protein [uncultured Salinisphaera sp.]|uniref:CBS domain-containing protein n=1 Tax=uncultured Salinisphaera sp. TaxID=359372 RepID=UPI0032B112B5
MSTATRACVADIMTPDVFTLKHDQTLYDARELMGVHQIRHVPILDESEQLVGLVTQKIVLREALKIAETHGSDQLGPRMAQIPLVEVLQHNFDTVSSETSLIEAGKLLLGGRQGTLPVVDNATLVGIVSHMDYVRMALELLESDAPTPA